MDSQVNTSDVTMSNMSAVPSQIAWTGLAGMAILLAGNRFLEMQLNRTLILFLGATVITAFWLSAQN
jgi:hypothetical protein